MTLTVTVTVLLNPSPRDNYENEEAYWADLPGFIDPERPQRTAAIAKRVKRDGILEDKANVKHVEARKVAQKSRPTLSFLHFILANLDKIL